MNTTHKYILTEQGLKLGRSPDNGIPLIHPTISREHAIIWRENSQVWIEDLRSANGTYVNRGLIQGKKALYAGDLIQIGPFRFQLNEDHCLQAFSEKNTEDMGDEKGVRLDVMALSQISLDKTLLDSISFSIKAGQMVALLGGSGAGKSTLLRALSGQSKQIEGDVLINGSPLYASEGAYRHLIGFVPQDDIIHGALTVYEALYFAAKLRLPDDLSETELQDRIHEVIQVLELNGKETLQVQKLSGGQRKRVSIGVELLSSPNLFFLDEPTSGLDPGLERTMMEFLKSLSKLGKTVLLTTHTVANLHVCDRVIFLTPGGRLAFFGPPKKALTYFKVQDYSEIYRLLDQEPERWQMRFEQSQDYVQEIIHTQSQYITNISDANQSTSAHRQTQRKQSLMRQWLILTQRYAQVIRRDRATLISLMMQGPIIVLLMYFCFEADIFDLGSASAPNTLFLQSPVLLFLISCSALWFGISNATQEIIREYPIFLRERLVNLRLFSYVMSKFSILGALSVLQALFLVLACGLWFHIPGLGHPGIWLNVSLTSLAGVGMGLSLSAWARLPLKAMGLLPILLIPQILFSGSVLPVDHMLWAGRALAKLMVAYWSYQGLGLQTEIAQSSLTLIEGVPGGIFQLPEAVRNGFNAHSESVILIALSLSVFIFFVSCLMLLNRASQKY